MTGAYIVTLKEIVQRGFDPDRTDVFFMVMKKEQPVPYCYCCGMLKLYKYWRKDNHSVCPPDDAMLLQVVLYSHGSIALPRVYDRFQTGKTIDYADATPVSEIGNDPKITFYDLMREIEQIVYPFEA